VSGLFLWYVEHSPIVEFPQWALAAYWFYKPEDVAWMPFAGYDFGISERVFIHDYGTLTQDPAFAAKLSQRKRTLTASRIRTSEVSPYLCHMRRAHYGHESKYVQVGGGISAGVAGGISQGVSMSAQTSMPIMQCTDAETQTLFSMQESSAQCYSEDNTMHRRLDSKTALGECRSEDRIIHASLESQAAMCESQTLPDTQVPACQGGSSAHDDPMLGSQQATAVVGDNILEDHPMHGGEALKAVLGDTLPFPDTQESSSQSGSVAPEQTMRSTQASTPAVGDSVLDEQTMRGGSQEVVGEPELSSSPDYGSSSESAALDVQVVRYRSSLLGRLFHSER